jgi:hypothetical protein
MQTQPERKFSKKELESLDGLVLNPFERQQLLDKVPIYERILGERLTPLQVFKILYDKEDVQAHRRPRSRRQARRRR